MKLSLRIVAGLFIAVLTLLVPWQSTALAATAPGAPTNLAETPGDSQTTLTWAAPSSDGGAAITRYEYRHILGAPTSLGGIAWTEVGTALTVTGLTNGREYTVEARAVNSVGEGSSASILATLAAAGPLTELTVSPGTPKEEYRPSSLNPALSFSTYNYTVTATHTDTHVTFDATTETGYEKELRIVGNLGFGEFWAAARDLGPTVPGHQVQLSYGENHYRYSIELEDSDAVDYHYNITVTRPFPPLRIWAPMNISSKSHGENRSELINKYKDDNPGHDIDNQTWSLAGDDGDDFSLFREGDSHVLRFSSPPD